MSLKAFECLQILIKDGHWSYARSLETGKKSYVYIPSNYVTLLESIVD